MRVSLLLCLSLSFLFPSKQSLENSPVKGISLNSPLTSYEKSLYLITGDESVYKKYASVRESLLNNIRNGIREGIYQGNKLDIIEGNKASKMSLFFYKKELYKVRWSFGKKEYPNLGELTKNINDYFLNKYGKVTDNMSGSMGPGDYYDQRVWTDQKIFLQMFGDPDQLQIEYRDEQIHQKVEALN